MIKIKCFDTKMCILVKDSQIELKRKGKLDLYEHNNINYASIKIKNIKAPQLSFGTFVFEQPIDKDIDLGMLKSAQKTLSLCKKVSLREGDSITDIKSVNGYLTFSMYSYNGGDYDFVVWYFRKITDSLFVNFHYEQHGTNLEELERLTKLIVDGIIVLSS